LPALILFEEEIKGRWCEIWQLWSWENILTPFPMPIIENSSGDGSLGDSQAKNKFGTDILGLLSPKTSLNLC
jgi:hypothetical protein